MDWMGNVLALGALSCFRNLSERGVFFSHFFFWEEGGLLGPLVLFLNAIIGLIFACYEKEDIVCVCVCERERERDRLGLKQESRFHQTRRSQLLLHL